VARQVAHTLARALAVEVATLQCGQRNAYGYDIADGWQAAHVVIGILSDVYRNVAAIALGPSVLPKVACHLGRLLNLCLQCRALLKYAHFSRFFISVLFRIQPSEGFVFRRCKVTANNRYRTALFDFCSTIYEQMVFFAPISLPAWLFCLVFYGFGP
jgi:hypothetical protein